MRLFGGLAGIWDLYLNAGIMEAGYVRSQLRNFFRNGLLLSLCLGISCLPLVAFGQSFDTDCNTAQKFSGVVLKELQQIKRWLQVEQSLAKRAQSTKLSEIEREKLNREFQNLQKKIYAKIMGSSSSLFKEVSKPSFYFREGISFRIPKELSGQRGQLFDTDFYFEDIQNLGDVIGRKFKIFPTDSLAPPLNLNFHSIVVSEDLDKKSEADRSNSSLAFSEAVNRIAGTTGIFAKILPNIVVLNGEALEELFKAGLRLDGDLELNGVSVKGSFNSLGEFGSYLEGISQQTGVDVETRAGGADSSTKDVILRTNDGRNMVWRALNNLALEDLQRLLEGMNFYNFERGVKIAYGSVELYSLRGPFYLEDLGGILGPETNSRQIDEVIYPFQETSLLSPDQGFKAGLNLSAAEYQLGQRILVINELAKSCGSSGSK